MTQSRKASDIKRLRFQHQKVTNTWTYM